MESGQTSIHFCSGTICFTQIKMETWRFKSYSSNISKPKAMMRGSNLTQMAAIESHLNLRRAGNCRLMLGCTVIDFLRFQVLHTTLGSCDGWLLNSRFVLDQDRG